MGKRTALVLAYYFPPMGLSGVQRIAKFVKYLPESGWDVHVVAPGPVAYYAYDDSLLHDVEREGVTIHRTASGKAHGTGTPVMKMPREWLRKSLSRISSAVFVPDNKKKWMKQALALARTVIAEHKPDVIFTSGPPFSLLMAGAQLSRETGIPLVVDYRDLWVGNQFHAYPTPWHKHRHQELEYDALKHTSKAIVTNRRIKERLVNTHRHLGFEDVVIIPHGYDPDDFRSAPATGRHDALRLAYTGLFYDFVTPKYFFQGVQAFLAKNPQAKIELHFAGILRDEYKKMARKLGLQDVLIDHGYLAHTEAVQLLQESDALWMMVGRGRNTSTVSSGKLYEYFGSRKPLLVSVEQGALRKDAERYGASWITEPDDVQAIATSIGEIYALWKQGKLPHPNEEVVLQHDRRLLTEELARQLAMSTRI